MALVQSPCIGKHGSFFSPAPVPLDHTSQIDLPNTRRLSRGRVEKLDPNQDYVWVGSMELGILMSQQQQEQISGLIKPTDQNTTVKSAAPDVFSAEERGSQQETSAPALAPKDVFSDKERGSQQETSAPTLAPEDAKESEKQHEETNVKRKASEELQPSFKRCKLTQADANALEEKLRGFLSLDQTVQQIQKTLDESLKEQGKMKMALDESLKEQGRMRMVLDDSLREQMRLNRRMDEMTLLFEDGELIFLCDVMENLPVKISYAIQTVAAKELQGKGIRFQQAYFEDFSTDLKSLYALTYKAVLNELLALKEISWEVYITQQQEEQHAAARETRVTGATQTEQQRKVAKLEKLFDDALRMVADELEVSKDCLELTTAAYFHYLKPSRNDAAHRNQLHEPIYKRRCNGRVDDPSPPAAIQRCLDAPPENELLGTPERLMRMLQMLGGVQRNMRNTMGEWIFEMVDEAVVNSICFLLTRRLSPMIAGLFRTSLLEHDKAPAMFPDLLARFEVEQGVEWSGWHISHSADQSYHIWLSRDGLWLDASYNQVLHPFGDWPRLC